MFSVFRHVTIRGLGSKSDEWVAWDFCVGFFCTRPLFVPFLAARHFPELEVEFSLESSLENDQVVVKSSGMIEWWMVHWGKVFAWFWILQLRYCFSCFFWGWLVRTSLFTQWFGAFKVVLLGISPPQETLHEAILKRRQSEITTFSRRSRMENGVLLFFLGGGGISLRTKIWEIPFHLSQFQLLHSLYRFSWNQNLTGWINVHRNITWPISFLEKVANSKGIHSNSGYSG